MDDEEEFEVTQQSPLTSALSSVMEPTTSSEAQSYSRRILTRELGGARQKEMESLRDEMERKAEEARATLRTARQKILARRYGTADAWLAAAQAFGSPTRTGAFGETIGNVAGALREPLSNKRQFEREQEREVLDLDERMGSIDQRLLAARLSMLRAQGDSESRLATEALRTLGKRVGSPRTGPLSKGEEAVDRAYAKDFVEFIQTGAAESSKALEELGEARDRLRGYRVKDGKVMPIEKENLTGPVLGTVASTPFIGKGIQDIAFPASSDVREMVEYTVQQSLRPILGAQFTEKEGERLISRVYNPRLDEKINAKRLDRLISMLQRARAEKVKAAEYFRENGTLVGFEGRTSWSMDDIWPEDGGSPSGPVEDPSDYNPDDYAPAVEPSGTPSVKKTGSTARKRVKLKDLPKKKGFLERLGFAEGGEVEAEMLEVEMPDGSIELVPVGTTQEELMARFETAAEEGEDETLPGLSLSDAVQYGGSILGGMAAGKVGTMAAHGIADMVVPGHRIKKAERPIVRALESEGLQPRDIASRVSSARRKGVPAMAMDVGGPELRSLAEMSMTPGNPETRTLINELEGRQKGSRERVSDQLNQGLKPDPYLEQEKKLTDNLYSQSKPLYAQAYANNQQMSSKQLFKILETPSGRKAVKEAVKALKDNPKANIGKVDAMGMVQKPSLEFLDQVKRQLDDMIRKEEGVGPSHQFTEKGKRLRDLRETLLTEMDTLAPDYKAARAQYAGDLEVLDALRTGRKDFTKMSPEQLKQFVSGLSFAEKDAFRTGVAEAINRGIGRPSQNINAAQRVIGSPDMAAKLEALFDKPSEFKMFKEALQLESEMFENTRDTLRVGKRGVGAVVEPQPGPLAKAAQKAPELGIWSPTQWVLKLLRRKPELSNKDTQQILKLLRSGDKASLDNFVKTMGSKVGRTAKRKSRSGKAGKVGAAFGAALPFLMQYMGDDDEAPEETETEEVDLNDPVFEGLTPEQIEASMRPAE